MESEWVTKEVSSIAQINTDTYSFKENWDFVNYLDTGNITEGAIAGVQYIDDMESLPSRARRKVKKGDIVYSTVRPNQKHYGIISNPPKNMLVSTGFAVLRGIEGICDTKFLYFFLTQRKVVEYLQAIAEHNTSAYPSIRPSDIGSLEIGLPPFPEQHAIARILGTLDDKIELNRKMNATLEAMAQAIFKSWFVDFDPVRAKMEGEEPAGMDAETAALFPDAFEEVGGQEVPVGWIKATIGDFIDVVKGRSYKSAELKGSDKALVTLKSFQRGGGYREDGLKPYIGDFKPEQIVVPGELIVAFTDVTQEAEVIGRPAIVSASPAFSILIASLDVGIIRSRSSSMGIPYLYNLFMSEDFQAHIAGYTSGTTVLHLAKDAIPSYQFVKPDEFILNKYQEIAGPIFNLIEQNMQQSRTLAALRDTLLPKLISGEIRVPDAMLEATEA